MNTDDPLPPEGENRPDADAFGRALAPGTGFNLLVKDVERAARFQAAVLGATVDYWDQDFAILRAGTEAGNVVWMLNHDRTYRSHPLAGIVRGGDQGGGRGAGAELRLYGRDPDVTEAAARAVEATLGGVVLAGAADKPHGLREAYILDPEGYCWVPGIATRQPEN